MLEAVFENQFQTGSVSAKFEIFCVIQLPRTRMCRTKTGNARPCATPNFRSLWLREFRFI